MRRAAWLHFAVEGVSKDAEKIASALAEAGLDAYSLAAKTPRTLADSGIVFFDLVSSELCDFIRKASRNGAARVLAVALPQASVDSNGLWTVLDAGATDGLLWARMANPAREIAARIERWGAVDALVDSPVVANNVVGRSPLWKSILRQVVEVARFTEASILILGETGTGKELIARLISTLDPRPNKKELVTLACTTIVPELSGSEFFGHERGAFTGAVGLRDGAFALANKGSLFLDEVGELPPVLQAQLLRVIQEKTYRRVGGNHGNARNSDSSLPPIGTYPKKC